MNAIAEQEQEQERYPHGETPSVEGAPGAVGGWRPNNDAPWVALAAGGSAPSHVWERGWFLPRPPGTICPACGHDCEPEPW
ncbi:MAG: hypothetical protein AAB368_04130 [bacterium]